MFVFIVQWKCHFKPKKKGVPSLSKIAKKKRRHVMELNVNLREKEEEEILSQPEHK